MIPILHSLPRWLFAPHPRVTEPEKVQRSWLLSAILFVLVLLGTIILLIVINEYPKHVDAPEVHGALVILGISAVMSKMNAYEKVATKMMITAL